MKKSTPVKILSSYKVSPIEKCNNCDCEINLEHLTTYYECEICWSLVCLACGQGWAGDNWKEENSADGYRCSKCPAREDSDDSDSDYQADDEKSDEETQEYQWQLN